MDLKIKRGDKKMRKLLPKWRKSGDYRKFKGKFHTLYGKNMNLKQANSLKKRIIKDFNVNPDDYSAGHFSNSGFNPDSISTVKFVKNKSGTINVYSTSKTIHDGGVLFNKYKKREISLEKEMKSRTGKRKESAIIKLNRFRMDHLTRRALDHKESITLQIASLSSKKLSIPTGTVPITYLKKNKVLTRDYLENRNYRKKSAGPKKKKEPGKREIRLKQRNDQVKALKDLKRHLNFRVNARGHNKEDAKKEIKNINRDLKKLEKRKSPLDYGTQKLTKKQMEKRRNSSKKEIERIKANNKILLGEDRILGESATRLGNSAKLKAKNKRLSQMDSLAKKTEKQLDKLYESAYTDEKLKAKLKTNLDEFNKISKKVNPGEKLLSLNGLIKLHSNKTFNDGRQAFKEKKSMEKTHQNKVQDIQGKLQKLQNKYDKTMRKLEDPNISPGDYGKGFREAQEIWKKSRELQKSGAELISREKKRLGEKVSKEIEKRESFLQNRYKKVKKGDTLAELKKQVQEESVDIGLYEYDMEKAKRQGDTESYNDAKAYLTKTNKK